MLNGFDIFCLPSSSGEALSNSLLEAIATELPVVATRVGDTPLVIADRGLLVDPDDSLALAYAWEHIAANLDAFREKADRARFVISQEFQRDQQLALFTACLLD